MIDVTRRTVAVINLFMGAACVERWLECVQEKCFTEAPINTPVAFYIMIGAALVVIVASLVALFAKRAPFAWSLNVLAILILVMEPSLTAVNDRPWPVSEYSRVDFIDVFVGIVWLFLNLLQTWGLNTGGARVDNAEELSTASASRQV